MSKTSATIRQNAALLIAVTFAVLTGGFATAFVKAAIPDSQKVIHGCYRTQGGLVSPQGVLRVIDSEVGQTCSANETAINWNQTGPQGPSGPGSVSSNRLVVPQDGIEQKLLTLPGLGDVYTDCSITNVRWKFINTSSQSVSIVNSQAEVLPGGSYTTDTPMGTFLLGSGSGQGSVVASMIVSQSVQPQPCTYTAQATIDTN